MSRQPAAAPEAEQKGALDRWLTPKVVLPVIGVLVVASLVFGLLFALADDGSGTGAEVVIQSCSTETDSGCTLRQATHLHADFALFIEGEQFSFNSDEFVSSGGGELHPFVHIHPERYTVVHVHMSGTTWDEFFTAMGFTLSDATFSGSSDQTAVTMPDGTVYRNDDTNRWRFFVNGVEVDGIARTLISDLQRVLVTYGPENAPIDEQLATVTDEACISSKRCPDRIPPGEPPEECQGAEGGVCN